jgi:serine/threonine protein kinase
MIADQLLQRIEFIHRRGVIHRDIKPDNFALGQEPNCNVIYAIDFGLSKRWMDAKSGEHIAFEDGKQMLGTARYTSLNTHRGVEQSRRDDLEGIAYLLVYLMTGSLPWIGVKAETRAQKHMVIAEIKASISPEKLCSGLPAAFSEFLKDVRRLEFDEEPSYSAYREMFRELFLREGYVYDDEYDWVAEPRPRSAAIYPLLTLPETGPPTQRVMVSRQTERPASILPPVAASGRRKDVPAGKTVRHPSLTSFIQIRRRALRT